MTQFEQDRAEYYAFMAIADAIEKWEGSREDEAFMRKVERVAVAFGYKSWDHWYQTAPY